jgi:hypothetical protein
MTSVASMQIMLSVVKQSVVWLPDKEPNRSYFIIAAFYIAYNLF